MVSAKLIITMLAAVAITMCYADDPVKCYKCEDCEDYDDKTATIDCPSDKSCFILGSPDKNNWTRGCDADSYCNGKIKGEEILCTTCKGDKCNTAINVVFSMTLTAIMAVILKYVR